MNESRARRLSPAGSRPGKLQNTDIHPEFLSRDLLFILKFVDCSASAGAAAAALWIDWVGVWGLLSLFPDDNDE